MDGSAGMSSGTSDSFVPSQLAMLVPQFDPAKDNIETYTQKVELLLLTWPESKLGELATRLILNTSGTAFQKLQLHREEITKNSQDSIKRIIQLLGGHWGQIGLERRYECAERALFRLQQKPDETADSYLARADVLWTELTMKKFKLEDLQAYVTLRGSTLSPDDKKRVLVEADGQGSGELRMEPVKAAIRMLGAGFFHEMTGNKTQSGKKTYDAKDLITEAPDEDNESYEVYVAEDPSEEQILEQLIAEGDEDACYVAEYEQAVNEITQDDSELAQCFNSYQDARRRLSERFKNRGFWPVHKGKGKSNAKGKGIGGVSKGKGGKGSGSNLQSRILNSHCRLCGAKGHWKAECPHRHRGPPLTTSSTPSTAPTSFVTTGDVPEASGLPLEFLDLPELPSLDEAKQQGVLCLMSVGNHSKTGFELCRNVIRQRLSRNERAPDPSRSEKTEEQTPTTVKAHDQTGILPAQTVDDVRTGSVAEAFFASQGTWGVLDSGATKTVIGSQLVKDLIAGLSKSIQEKLSRCACRITFRFGNQATLQSEFALVIPIGSLKLKVAVVPGTTPFLLSNTLLRTLGAVIDTRDQSMFCKLTRQTVPLKLSSSGLFLVDMNQLCAASASPLGKPQVTFAVSDTESATPLSERELPQVPVEMSMPLGQEATGVSVTHTGSSPQAEPCSLFETHHAVDPKDVFDAETQAGPSGTNSPGRDREGRCMAVGRDARVEDRVQQEAQGEHLRGGLADRPGVCGMVPAEVLDVSETRTPLLHAVHRGEDLSPGRDGANHSQVGERGDVSAPTDASSDVHQVEGGPTAKFPSGGDGRGGDAICRDRVPPGDRDGQSAGADDEPRDGHERDPALYPQSSDATVGPSEWDLLQSTGEVDPEHEHDMEIARQPSPEAQEVRRLVRMIQHELEVCQAKVTAVGDLDLLEVFAEPDSQLTLQSLRRGLKAARHGLSDGDLETPEGRQHLFTTMLSRPPRHIWVSPVCTPWSAWSRLNEAKSMTSLHAVAEARWRHLPQVALGIVLCRHQLGHGRHIHWEQPRGSNMFYLAGMHEVRAYTMPAMFDMCVAGDLVDPVSGKPIRKPMQVWTSSMSLHEQLHNQRCHHDPQEHQTLEGTTKLVSGNSISHEVLTSISPEVR